MLKRVLLRWDRDVRSSSSVTFMKMLKYTSVSVASRRSCHPQVVSIVPYGAFVNIEGNIDGLVHISEMAMGRVDSVEDVVQVCALMCPSFKRMVSTIDYIYIQLWTTFNALTPASIVLRQEASFSA